MQKLTLTHTNIRINTSTRIVDFGEVPQSSIFVEGSVEVQYLFLPKQPGTYSRNIILQGGVRFIGRGLVLQ